MNGRRELGGGDAGVTGRLSAYLAGARWFGGKGRPFHLAGLRRLGEVRAAATAGEPRVVVDLVDVAYDDAVGGTESYQLPLALYADPQPRLEHAHIAGWVEPDGGSVHAYDAVHDRDAMDAWLRAFAEEATGDLAFHRLPGHELDLDVHSTLLGAEQSNSSVAFGDDSLLKVFRRVTPGVNPDIEIHERLTLAGSEHVAALYGWVEHPEHGLQLGMLQQFLRTGSDGWELAQASVRNLFAEADLHAAEVGGDFAAEAERLGAAVAEVHAVLRAELGAGRVAAEPVADRMRDRLEAALVVVPELAEHEAFLRERFDRLAALGELEVQRIHGDLHLGQTLRTVKGWKVVDFEGEPARPLAERALPDARWRDVAGMLRSFDYAAGVVERTAGAEAPASEEQLRFRGGEWVERNRRAFLASYAGRALTPTESDLLTAYLADKVVYEAVYEARNRPTWVSIPLEALARWRSA